MMKRDGRKRTEILVSNILFSDLAKISYLVQLYLELLSKFTQSWSVDRDDSCHTWIWKTTLNCRTQHLGALN